MTLQELFAASSVMPLRLEGDADFVGLRLDSRAVRAGDLFVCQAGTVRDSHSFLNDARERGAVAALAHTPEGYAHAQSLGLAVALLPSDAGSFNKAIWQLCDVFHRHPTRDMKVVGVTGTNGKTTTAWLVRDLLSALHVPSGYLGTLGFQIPGLEQDLQNTTPFAVELYGLLAQARDAQVKALALEISSHALTEYRSDGVELDVGVYTNLTQDHLDFHGSMEEYEAAKQRMFTALPSKSKKAFTGAFNVHDPAALRAAKVTKGRKIGFGTAAHPDMDLSVVGIAESVRVDGITLRLSLDGSPEVRAEIPLGGNYNVENSLAAAAAMVGLGYGLDVIAEAFSKVRPVPGRFEAVPNETGIGILVDYAHTPDALVKLLDAVRPLTGGKIITVFGCGGDRDSTKRPLMAQAASSHSDLSVVTSDNPRTEDPQAILDQVKAGVLPGRCSVDILDRAEAVAYAVKAAKPGDVVVIAGKGHENYQIIGRTKHPMDDRALAREALEAR